MIAQPHVVRISSRPSRASREASSIGTASFGLVCVLLSLVSAGPAWADDDEKKPKLKIVHVLDDPDPFSPNTDGRRDTATIHVEVTVFKGFGRKRVLEVTTTIRSSGGERVRTLTTREPLLPGQRDDDEDDDEKKRGNKRDKDDDNNRDRQRVISIDQTWNGKDRRGQLAPDGVYDYQVRARILKLDRKDDEGDEKAKTDPVQGTLTLDTTPPNLSASISPPRNPAGWNRTDVAVSFQATDALSGIADVTPPTTLTAEGANQVVNGTATDRAGNMATASVTVNLDKTPPSLAIGFPADGAQLNNPQLAVTGNVGDALSGVARVTCNGAQATLSNASFTCGLSLSGGTNPISVQATDIAGNLGFSNITVALLSGDVSPPVTDITSPQNLSLFSASPITVTGTVDDPTATITVNGVAAVVTAGTFTATGIPLQAGTNTIVVTATDAVGNVSTASVQVTFTPPIAGLPPDPSTVAPPIDQTVATMLATATEFLYTGANPIQTGVAVGTITPIRAAVLRGKVLERGGTAVSGVRISILNHPEFGQTLSRADGMFDLAVNGGGLVTVQYQKAGFPSAQRQVQVPWQDYVVLEDLVLVPFDTKDTIIDFQNICEPAPSFVCHPKPMQVAQGSPVTDADGTRQATLLFPEGTRATMAMTDGSSQEILNLHVRATEFTVGPNGPRAMPAPLPPTSGYTYAVEFSVDEAVAAGATEVRFDRPVIHYVDNFLGFPVGGAVPTGYYDRQKGAWIPSQNGRIIKIMSISNGLADLDTDGDGAADSETVLQALGVTTDERQNLATLYQSGQSLWRVPITHFSPWDCNWSIRPPLDAPAPQVSTAPVDPKMADPGIRCGSLIECQNQVLGESLGIAGTPFSLNYRSDRAPGRQAAYTLDIPLSGATLHASLRRIELEISVAGQKATQSFPATPNQRYSFTWDGKDAYGRTVQGLALVTVRVGYVYRGEYQQPAQLAQSFAIPSGITITGSEARQEIALWQVTHATFGMVLGSQVGGWSLSPHHEYDAIGKVLYLGDGTRRDSQSMGGSAVITTVAGGGSPADQVGDGGPATLARLYQPYDVAVGPDGSLYIADPFSTRLRRVGPDGIITTVAGNGNAGFSGDGGPATEAWLQPAAIAVAPDGSLYIADFNNRIRRVGPDGIITTVAGNGTFGFSGDGGPATQAPLSSPLGIALAPDGNLYFADQGNQRIRRVASATPGLGLADITIASEDGAELYVFAGGGHHLRTLDALTGSVRFQFGYDNAGRLISMTDGDTNVTTVERDAGGQPTAIVAPFGQHTTLTADANGFLVAVTNPAGETVQLSSTPDGLLTGLTDPKNGAHQFTYDALGRLIRDDDPAGGFMTLARSETANGYQVAVSTALGHITTHLVERLSTGGMRRSDTDPSGAVTETVINTDGSRRITYPDGTVDTLVEGPDPRWGMQAPIVTSSTRTTPGGLVQTTTGARVAVLTNPLDPFSLQTLTDTFTVNGRTSTRVYNAADRTLVSTSAANRVVTTTLDARGRVVSSQVAGLEPATFTYDARGRLSSSSQGAGPTLRSISFTYGADGFLASLTDPLGRTAGFTYDAAGRVTSRTLPGARTEAYSYDANSNVSSITPPGGTAHAFGYTPLDLEASYTPPSLPSGATPTAYTYNADRQLAQVTRPDATTVDFVYDAAGRPASVTLPRGAIGSSYDSAGRLNGMSAPGGLDLAYAYDGGLLTSTALSGPVAGSVSGTYDTSFRLTAVSVNGANPVSFAYDSDDLLTSAGAMTLSRDAQNGLLTGTALGVVTDVRTYNGFAEPATYAASTSGAAQLSAQYTRDALGRITTKTETLAGVTDTYVYTYDPTGRVTGVQKNGAAVEAYTYDLNGNRLSAGLGGAATIATYDAQDRLNQYGAAAYTYTEAGELATKTTGAQTTTYSYDQVGNLLAAALPGGPAITYLVDGQNRRVAKQVNGVLVQGFLYQSGLQPIAELDGTGAVVSRFVYATNVNVPAYMVKGGATYRIITDQLGSPRLVVNTATGAIAQRMAYDSFGNVLADTNPGFQPFGFAGGLYDRDTKLVRFGVRDYDAETGRWTAKDPIGFGGRDTNLYAYVGNDPVNRVDPKGLVSLAGGAAIVGILGYVFFEPAFADWSYAVSSNAKTVCLLREHEARTFNVPSYSTGLQRLHDNPNQVWFQIARDILGGAASLGYTITGGGSLNRLTTGTPSQ